MPVDWKLLPNAFKVCSSQKVGKGKEKEKIKER